MIHQPTFQYSILETFNDSYGVGVTKIAEKRTTYCSVHLIPEIINSEKDFRLRYFEGAVDLINLKWKITRLCFFISRHSLSFMPMLIQEKTLNHWIDNFYGYGSWQAKAWLIAFEESGGELPEEVAEKINYFGNAHAATREPTLCDIRELYRHLTLEGPRADLLNRYEYRFVFIAVRKSNKILPDTMQHGITTETVFVTV